MQPSDDLPTLQHVAELERRRQVAESLRSTLGVLNSRLPVEKILFHIANQACPLLNADAAAIYRLQIDGMLAIQASVGLGADFIQHSSIPLGELATGRSVLTQTPVFIPEISAIEPPREEFGAQLADLLNRLSKGYRSLLAVPLIIRAETYGALTLYYREAHEISKEEVDLAKDFSVQAALAIENARLRTQMEQDAVAAERNRLARELHDSVTQMLFSASLIAEVLPSIWQRSPEQGMEGLNEIRQLTSGALAEMRSLLLELRPHALEEARLEDLLPQLAESISGRIRTPVAVHIQGQALLPVDVRVAFYRIAQEAFNNIVKHSQADQISLSLNCTVSDQSGQCRRAEMTIVDNGCGFDNGPESASHFGFNIMRERALAIRSQLEISSRVNCGTRITLVWTSEEDGNL
ncbi:MAG TPA: GAF domain-containing sensor histidine kinase [Anaerolineaceae bacterium]|nr:GAF domain-containing sensor histidine kinase [Anaerolineaceae bacterium]